MAGSGTMRCQVRRFVSESWRTRSEHLWYQIRFIRSQRRTASSAKEQKAARERIYAAPLESLNPGDAHSFMNEEMWWKFERLRPLEDPVHYTPESGERAWGLLVDHQVGRHHRD